MMDQPGVQTIDLKGKETTIVESKIILKIKNIEDFTKEIETMKTQLTNIDAEWWMTIGPKQMTMRHGVLVNQFPIKFEYNEKPDQTLEPEKCKFSVDATMDGRDLIQGSKWHELSLLSKPWFPDIKHQKFDWNENQPQNISMIVTFRIKTSSMTNKFYNPYSSYRDVIVNNSKMLEDSILSDFTFDVKGKIFKVHKCVLATVSPVFNRLFTSDMRESHDNSCKIDSIEAETFDCLLRFIYEGRLPESFDAKNLYEAAHFYELKNLKEICEQEICFKLSSDNAVNLYSWAFTYDLNNLKKEAWIIVKRDVLKMHFRIKGEPLDPEGLQELISKKHEFLTKYRAEREEPVVKMQKRF